LKGAKLSIQNSNEMSQKAYIKFHDHLTDFNIQMTENLKKLKSEIEKLRVHENYLLENSFQNQTSIQIVNLVISLKKINLFFLNYIFYRS
jgi:hypothetical protein